MVRRISGFAAISLLALPILLGGAARADDPPTRVGRVSYLSGTVSFHAADQDQWSAATLNYPVIAGNAFWTEPGGHAELEIGPLDLRLDQATEADVSALDEKATEITLPQGHLAAHLIAPSQSESYRVATPRGTVELTGPGDYQIDAGTDKEPTRVTITRGSAELVLAGAPVDLHAGEMAVVTGAEPGDYTIQTAQPVADTQWSRPPVVAEARPAPSDEAPLPPAVTGARDLDRYGHWARSESYGRVWYPDHVAPDWAPYRDGHWRWVEPWGWTWVDDEPWGFAPFHYGRWAHISGGWAWVPDGIVVERVVAEPYYVEPVYAPALVAFVGGASWGVSIGFGDAAFGWIPLGPGERFYPAFRCSPRYVNRVNVTRVVNVTNVTNVTNITNNTTINHYMNQSGATVIRANALRGNQSIAQNRLNVSTVQLQNAPRAASLNPLVPQHLAEIRTAQVSPVAPKPVAPSLVVARPTLPPIPPAPVAPIHTPEIRTPVASAPARPTMQATPSAPGPALRNATSAIQPAPAPMIARPQQATMPIGRPTSPMPAPGPAIVSHSIVPLAPQPPPHPVAQPQVSPPPPRPTQGPVVEQRPVEQRLVAPSPPAFRPAPVVRQIEPPAPAPVPRPAMVQRPIEAPHPQPVQHYEPPAQHYAAPPPVSVPVAPPVQHYSPPPPPAPRPAPPPAQHSEPAKKHDEKNKR
jgi:hypothetical protein